MTIIMVTHSAESAAYARRIMQVSDGRLQEDRSVVAAGLRMAS
jgi:ABC-type lipoprotein export system ATPase subunit